MLDEYRVKVEKNYEGNKSFGNYLLRVYNEEIRLFTPNGLISTKFRCPIADIHKVKYNSFGSQECCVTISIKNNQTKFVNKHESCIHFSCTKETLVVLCLQ